MFSQAILLLPAPINFFKSANIFHISIRNCFLNSSSFSFLRLNLSPSNFFPSFLLSANFSLNFTTTIQWSASECYVHEVICFVDSFETFGGLVVFVTPVRSHPGPSSFLYFYILFLFFYMAFGIRTFSLPCDFLALWPSYGFRVSSWEVLLVARRREWDSRSKD